MIIDFVYFSCQKNEGGLQVEAICQICTGKAICDF